jgi:hypothetical protein
MLRKIQHRCESRNRRKEAMSETVQYHTRKSIVALANSRNIPLVASRLNKDCAAGRGPEVCAIYNERGLELYTPESVERYLASKITPVTQELTEKFRSKQEARQRARFSERVEPPPAAT